MKSVRLWSRGLGGAWGSACCLACGVFLACGTVILACGSIARAGTVKGQVTLALERTDSASEGLWRVDNGILPVSPRAVDLRTECLIVLVPRNEARGKEMKKEEPVSAELRGLRLLPQVIAVPLGAALEIKNEDRVPHALWAKSGEETVFPARVTPAGATRSERLQRPGTFEIRDEEQPHLRAWVVVTDGGHVLRTDERGVFRGEIPDGRYVLRVFARGSFAIERNVEVSAKTPELQLNVPAPEARGASR